ncbi:MAG: hypothetical protein QOF14_2391 [Hyphomicrobiales bacterium]|nr:hypothetical protein [Hyphomicrobiales bacterium]
MRIIVTVLFLSASSAAGLAQSSTATTGTAKPVSPPIRGPISDKPRPLPPPIARIPPAARSGESGLRVGEGAATGEPIEVRRMK